MPYATYGGLGAVGLSRREPLGRVLDVNGAQHGPTGPNGPVPKSGPGYGFSWVALGRPAGCGGLRHQRHLEAAKPGPTGLGMTSSTRPERRR